MFMIKFLAFSLIVGFLSLGSISADTFSAAQSKSQEQVVSRKINVFDEPFAEESIVFHYRRSNGNYTSWDL